MPISSLTKKFRPDIKSTLENLEIGKSVWINNIFCTRANQDCFWIAGSKEPFGIDGATNNVWEQSQPIKSKELS